jgi:uncharacterized membrane protein YdjX (TVP38/TMEM64 family)
MSNVFNVQNAVKQLIWTRVIPFIPPNFINVLHNTPVQFICLLASSISRHQFLPSSEPDLE